MNGRILVVDDEKNITFVIQAMLEKAGFEAVIFNKSQEALDALSSEEDFDLVVTDLHMPGANGMEILDYCQKNEPQLPIVMITAYGTVESAVHALKKGAFDYITKPFDQTELLDVVRKAVATHRAREQEPLLLNHPPQDGELSSAADPSPSGVSVASSPQKGKETEKSVSTLSPAEQESEENSPIALANPLNSRLVMADASAAAASLGPASESGSSLQIPPSMIGHSPQMHEVFKVISKIAQSPSTVLIWGESGTGKELVALEIHRQSSRAERPFIKINCAAIPATLIESELFGYERGAFTGAVASKPGRFELAHEGTLFLDEVAEMPLEMQVKLLRILQEQEFERVGGVNTIRVDARIITATNKDLEAEVRAGKFREDLFYRLNVVPIHLPPLRERKEDIEPLVHSFLLQFNKKLRKSIQGVSPSVLNVFRAHAWPGNIRQLENVLERMILMSDGNLLMPEDLPEDFIPLIASDSGLLLKDDEGASLKQIVRKQTQSLERNLIEKALEDTQGNVTRAAEKLKLSRKGLQLKMKELGLKRPFD